MIDGGSGQPVALIAERAAGGRIKQRDPQVDRGPPVLGDHLAQVLKQRPHASHDLDRAASRDLAGPGEGRRFPDRGGP